MDFGLQVLTTLVIATPLQHIYNSQHGNNSYILNSLWYVQVK